MAITIDFQIGVWNGWLFMILFPIQWMFILLLPGQLAERTGDIPEGRSRQYRVLSFLMNALWILASLYSVFLPFHLGTPWLWIGISLFVIGMMILLFTTVSIARTPKGSPFTSGVYRLSRHPGYLSMIMIYLAVSIAGVSLLFLIITILTFLMLHYSAKREEEWCCRTFGDAYRNYMAHTPRWIGIPNSAIR